MPGTVRSAATAGVSPVGAAIWRSISRRRRSSAPISSTALSSAGRRAAGTGVSASARCAATAGPTTADLLITNPRRRTSKVPVFRGFSSFYQQLTPFSPSAVFSQFGRFSIPNCHHYCHQYWRDGEAAADRPTGVSTCVGPILLGPSCHTASSSTIDACHRWRILQSLPLPMSSPAERHVSPPCYVTSSRLSRTISRRCSRGLGPRWPCPPSVAFATRGNRSR